MEGPGCGFSALSRKVGKNLKPCCEYKSGLCVWGLGRKWNSRLGTNFQKCFLFGAIPVNSRGYSREVRAGESEFLSDVVVLAQHSKGVFFFPFSPPWLELVWDVLSTPCTAVFIRALHARSKSRVKGVLQFMTGTILLTSNLFPTSEY